MGVGAAAILPATLAIIPIEFCGKDQVTAFSAWMATTAVGQAAAPAISGGLIEFLGWPAIFWVNVPLCALAFVLVNGARRPSRATRAPATASTTSASSPSPPASSPCSTRSTRGRPAAGAPTLVLGSVRRRRRAAHGLRPHRAPRRASRCSTWGSSAAARSTARSSTTSSTTSRCAGTMYVLALYLEEVRGYDAFTAGLLLLPVHGQHARVHPHRRAARAAPRATVPARRPAP